MLNFIKGGIYQIKNAGCGRQAVFFQKRNYRYFIQKMETYIAPYADILHYELKKNEISIAIHVKHLERYIPERKKMRSLAASIGIMLRSYAQAINNQEKREGVLWKGPTTADLQDYRPIEKDRIKAVDARNIQEFEAESTTNNHLEENIMIHKILNMDLPLRLLYKSISTYLKRSKANRIIRSDNRLEIDFGNIPKAKQD
jgi:hypothetical protein